MSTTGSANEPTPAMKQFHRFKQQYPGCVLFFRMGDFYEMFHDDAKLANKVLGVTLTQRTAGVPMAGVPYHSVEGYLRRMIQAGHRVAVCDQVENPAEAKGIVKRDVTRVITPGTLTDDSLLDEGSENPLAAVLFHSDERVSAAWAELSTGSLSLATFSMNELVDELARVRPRELLYIEMADGKIPPRVQALIDAIGCVGSPRPGWQFRTDEAIDTLRKQYGVASLAGFGFADDDPALGAASGVLHYVNETQRAASDGGAIAHIQPPRRFSRDQHLVIDQVSLRSLEVEQTIRSGGTDGSLLGVLRDCVTAMGKRQLRQWLCYPLRTREQIEERQRLVESLVNDTLFLDKLRQELDRVQDVQRIAGRVAVGRALPRDLVGLGDSAAQAGAIELLLAGRESTVVYHERISAVAATLTELAEVMRSACVESPPAHLREGGLIRDGFDAQLDEFRSLMRDSEIWLARYQKQLIDETGIQSLKVGYNKVFGYYIEVTAANRDKAPDAWSRKQTLKNAERYITPELKEYEGKVLSAGERAVARELVLVEQLCQQVREKLAALQAFSQVVAELDVLACFARRAIRFRYVKPQIVDDPVLHIRGGRHPVLDQLLGDRFVPNDVTLGRGAADTTDAAVAAGATLALITGPNMAGKSTYIRQTALIVLLAHTGCFVPADSAVVGLCDRIFTRIGASDELHAGQSTFMVEMTETANICHHATDRSLVILDEIGRGTSTLDGLSLAWAIAEHLALRKCRTLFATHYHEITQLADQYDNVANLNVTVREWQDQIVFLHRIVSGATDRSYGIHVAKIAGLPGRVVTRANELLAQLEVSHNTPGSPGTPGAGVARTTKKQKPDPQLSLFTQYLEHPAVESLKQADIDNLTPMQAFDLLRKLHEQAKGQ